MRDIEAALGPILKLLQPGMPKVVPDQRSKFRDDETFRRLAQNNPVVYFLHQEKPLPERRRLLQQELQSGYLTVAVTTLGITLRLVLDATPWTPRANGGRLVTSEQAVTDEHGTIHVNSRFILNGVCVMWTGHLDSGTLTGAGVLSFDEDGAEIEAQLLKGQLEEYNRLFRMSTNAAAAAEAAAAAATAASELQPQQRQRQQQQQQQQQQQPEEQSAASPGSVQSPSSSTDSGARQQ